MQVDEMLQREARRLRKEGRQEGRIQGKIIMIKNLINKNVQDDIIKDCAEISDKELKQIKQELIRQNA